jgi:hypothetical protein
MTTVPVALDGLVISDGRGNNDWISIIPDIYGLTQAQIVAAQRAGRYPEATGSVLLRQRALTLETYFPGNDQEDSRALLLRKILYERGEIQRLVLADDVLYGAGGKNMLLWLRGDLYSDDGTWKLRDILQPDDIEATLSGALHQVAGAWPGTRALMVEEATTNLVKNPPAGGTYTSGRAQNWSEINSAGFSATVATSEETSIVRRGESAQRVKVSSVTSSGFYALYQRYSSASAATEYTISVDLHQIARSGCHFRIGFAWRDSGLGFISSAYSDPIYPEDDQWDRYTFTATSPASTAIVDARVLVYDLDSGDSAEVILDGMQLEEAGYETSYIDGSLSWASWSGTEFDSTSTRTATEVNLDDHATLLSGNDTWTLSAWVQPQYDADGTWPDISNYVFDTRGADNNNRVILRYNSTDDRWDVYINGGDRIASGSAQTFSAGDWIHLVLTVDFSNDEYKLYVNGVLYDSSTTSLSHPTLTDCILLSRYNAGGNFFNGALAEAAVFDSILTAEEVSALYNTGDLNPRWINVMCNGSSPLREGRRVVKSAEIASLVTSGDVLSRQRDGDLEQWTVRSSGDTVTVNNRGDGYAYPIFGITPETTKSSGFTKRRWAPVKYAESSAISNYPVDITDGGIDLSASAQGDGDDIRVYLGSTEIDRWLGGTLVSDVKIWCNLNFSADVSMTLNGAITSGETVTAITVNEDIAGLDYSGVLLIDSEAFTYEGYSEATKTIMITGRAARDTSAAAHSDGATVYWIQNDLYIYYGDSTLSAPTTDDSVKPRFDLDDSTNTSWKYTQFGADDGDGNYNWIQDDDFLLTYGGEYYTGNQTANADPWTEAGVNMPQSTALGTLRGRWRTPVFPQNMITGASWDIDYNFTSNADGVGNSVMRLEGVDVTGDLTLDNTWRNYTKTQTFTATDQVIFAAYCYHSDTSGTENGAAEVNTCTLTLSSIVTVSVGSEVSVYELNCTITNNETGESMSLNYNLVLNDTLVIDTDERTITHEGASALTAKTLDETRLEWLPLAPGDNELEFTETGLQKVQVDIYWDVRTIE